MATDINQPITVEMAAPITMLESAMAALDERDAEVHLSAFQATALRNYFTQLRIKAFKDDNHS